MNNSTLTSTYPFHSQYSLKKQNHKKLKYFSSDSAKVRPMTFHLNGKTIGVCVCAQMPKLETATAELNSGTYPKMSSKCMWVIQSNWHHHV